MSGVLNITNGDYFNGYYLSKFGGVAVPFCEALMDGGVVARIYSDEFITLRAKSLNVTEVEYRSKMHAHDALVVGEYGRICLWFGKDTFCQVNLLTLLAYLEQIGYGGEVKLNYIDDETCALLEGDIHVTLGIYEKIYEEVLIKKIQPRCLGVLSGRAIELYFDYHSTDGALAKLARENAHLGKAELMKLLLDESKDYGLSDIQAERIINDNL